MRRKTQERSDLISADSAGVEEQEFSKRIGTVPDRSGTTEVSNDDEGRARDRQQEEVRRRAYEIYVERGKGEGQELEDWLQAEAEVYAAQRGRRQAA